MNNIKFDFDDILIEPEALSTIMTRNSINIYNSNNYLPLFTAPMDTVINTYNWKIFENKKINSIIPRQKDLPIEMLSNNNNWIALGLDQFIKYDSIYNKNEWKNRKILIDIANGHMESLHKIIKNFKNKHPEVEIRAGNIATPHAYELLSNAGADYIKVGIGFGGACLTSQQTGIGYPMGSLIKECYDRSKILDNPAHIIADGGFKKYSDIIKALSLGADFVMLGQIFNKSLESCADTYIKNIKHDGWTEPGEKIDQYSIEIKYAFETGYLELYKKFRGMSTKNVQKILKPNTKIKTSEGIIKMNKVEYTLDGWINNFSDYLKSAMSYTNSINLKEFIGQVKYNFISSNSLERFKK